MTRAVGSTTEHIRFWGLEAVARVFTNDQGQDLIEYALLTAIISLVSLTWIINLGTTTNSLYQGISGTVATIPGP